jgi:tape measure domain-containing protein
VAKDLTWIFKIVDQMSGPARAAGSAVAGLGGKLRQLGKDMDVGSAGFKIKGWADTIRMVATPLAELGGAAIKAQAFKEDTLLGLEIILQSREKANAVLADAMKFAAKTPFTTTQVMGWTKDLLVGGFNPKEAEMLMTVAGDFGALKGDDEYVQRVIFHLTKLNAVGRLTGETMMQLGEAGLPVGKVYESLAKHFGTTVQGVRQMQEAGRIDSGTGINAIVDAIAGLQGGTIGTVLNKRSQSLSGLWSTLKSRPDELFMSVGGGGMDRMKGALQTMADAFDPSSAAGQRITASLTRLSDTVTRLFIEPLSGPGGAQRVEKAISSVITVVEGLAYIFTGLGTVLGWVWSFLELMGEGLAKEAFAVWYAWDWVTTKLSAAWEEMKNVGTNLMKGLAWGIENGVTWVIDAISNMAGTVITTMKEKLGIHSPSAVFEGLGLNVVAGFQQGVDGGSAGASSSVESMVRMPSVGGAGRGVTLAPGAVVVTIQGAEAGNNIETRVRDAVLQALGQAFEQLGLEAGVA